MHLYRTNDNYARSRWKESNKQNIVKKEIENIKKITLRGTLTPQYKVLPPINYVSEVMVEEKTVDFEEQVFVGNNTMMLDKDYYKELVLKLGGVFILDDGDLVTAVPSPPQDGCFFQS